MLISDFFEKTYWVIDILPKQVPEGSRGQYFRIAEYYWSSPQINMIYPKFTHVLLKLNCYEDLDVSLDGEEWVENPAPEELVKMISNCLSDKKMCYILLKTSDVLITLSADDTYMTVYHPTEEILVLLGLISVSEGLFLWKP